MNWFWRNLGIIGTQGPNETERVMRILFALGGTMLATILLFGLLRSIALGSVNTGAMFVFWALAAAFVAFLIGNGTGMLFGLPTVRRIDVTGNTTPTNSSNPSATPSDVSTGYVESTSLEQVADFLVKGLVALSLTSFDSWMTRFDALAGNLTATMLGSPIACAIAQDGKTLIACPPDRVPGGLILAGFALLGFLVGYLWMRRYFIGEMVTARSQEIDIIIRAEQDRIGKARATGLTGMGASRSNDSETQVVVAGKIAEGAVAAVNDAARSNAIEIQESVTADGGDSDDPWKGAFGGSAAKGGCVLSATVSPLVSDPDNYQIDLLVTVVDPERRSELSGKTVHYYLHPTFGSKPRDVAIDTEGKAPLQLFSFGAFTVGVLIDDGTRLELDLSQIPGVPTKFIQR